MNYALFRGINFSHMNLAKMQIPSWEKFIGAISVSLPEICLATNRSLRFSCAASVAHFFVKGNAYGIVSGLVYRSQ